MRLLHVICSTDPESGGPVEALLRLSEVLLRDGHEVEVASLESQEEAASRGLPVPVIGLGSGLGRYRYNSRLSPWLREQAAKSDAVVLHGLWNYSSWGAWRALRGRPTPYYIFAHGMMDPWFRRQFPVKHLVKQIYWTIAEGRVLHDAKGVLFTSEEEQMRARNVFKGHSYKERVVLLGAADPGADSSAQRAAFLAAFPALRDKRILLYLSRIHPKKGCDLLIRAFAGCARQISPDIDLAIAGPDPLGWVPELSALAKELGIAKHVHWLGMLSGDLKWGAFRNAEAMILPSHQENFGLVIAEAMSCATPVLISNKVNIWREVESSQAGLIEPDTLAGTQNLILRFFALSSSQGAQMAKDARAGFLRHFDAEVAGRNFARAIGFTSAQAPGLAIVSNS
jgi:glycosyltransferase involved in cell wall biosynthesis